MAELLTPGTFYCHRMWVNRHPKDLAEHGEASCKCGWQVRDLRVVAKPPPSIFQVHSDAFKNAVGALPPGTVVELPRRSVEELRKFDLRGLARDAIRKELAKRP